MDEFRTFCFRPTQEMMLLHGVSVKVVQARLGHSQINLTLDTFSHILPAMDRDAAERLSALMA